MRAVSAAVMSVALLSGSSAAAAAPPPSVSRYVEQLRDRCERVGGKVSIESKLVQQVDVNRDKLSDWLVDERAMRCLGGPPIGLVDASQIVVFAGDKSGDALPVFQQAAYGARVEKRAIWVALRGSGCGLKAEDAQFCDRALVWNERQGRPELSAISQARKPSRIR